MDNIFIRPIQPADNTILATIIRNGLKEFNADKPGTVYYDPTTDHLYDLFTTPQSQYFVVLENDIILGGAGIYPTQNLPADTCELVKLYLSPSARAKVLVSYSSINALPPLLKTGTKKYTWKHYPN